MTLFWKSEQKMRSRLVAVGATVLFAVLFAGSVRAETTLTINGYGGSAWAAIEEYINAPYTKDTGVQIVGTTQPNLAQLKAMVESGEMTYEVLELSGQEYETAAKNGWLEEIDYGLADPEGKQPAEAKKKYGMVFSLYSTIIAYRTDRFPEGKGPQNWADFWNVKDFPGQRAMEDSVIGNLEFALMADGVPTEKVYEVLATDEGTDRAFRKMDEIKPNVIKWWKAGAEPVQLLAEGEVAMTTAWNGRVYALSKTKPVKAQWMQGMLHEALYGIPKGNKIAKEAMKYFRAYSHPERIAGFTKVMPYPGLLPGVEQYLPPELASELPSTNRGIQLTENNSFWDSRRDKLTERWNAWLLQ